MPERMVGCRVTEVGGRVEERSMVARREGKYDLWVSLLEENSFSLPSFDPLKK